MSVSPCRRTQAGFLRTLQSAILMLHYIDESAAANRIQAALDKVYAEKIALTRDVGGTAGTQAFANAVLAAL